MKSMMQKLESSFHKTLLVTEATTVQMKSFMKKYQRSVKPPSGSGAKGFPNFLPKICVPRFFTSETQLE